VPARPPRRSSGTRTPSGREPVISLPAPLRPAPPAARSRPRGGPARPAVRRVGARQLL